jgi:hypothetical protein
VPAAPLLPACLLPACLPASKQAKQSSPYYAQHLRSLAAPTIPASIYTTVTDRRPACPPPAAKPATVGEAWLYAGTGLMVRRAASTASGVAVVSVCRRGGVETATTCIAGIDNDCNGKAGAADPACDAFL